jgi:hypothetical protein
LTRKYGTTPDKPWKSINFALKEIIYPNFPYTRTRLLNNKSWAITEMYNWMLYQVQQQNSPFTSSSTFDKTKTYRDAEYIVDSLIYDICRGGNSKTVQNTLAYFAQENTAKFVNTATAAQIPYIIASLTFLQSLITNNVLGNTVPTTSYQTIMGVPVGEQIKFTNYLSGEPSSIALANTLFGIVLTALTSASVAGVPVANNGTTITLMVKTGDYAESMPMVVPEYVAVNGDELRGVVVQPKLIVNTYIDSTSLGDNSFSTSTTDGLLEYEPVQFGGTNIFGGIDASTTYYAVDTKYLNPGVSEVATISYLNATQFNNDKFRHTDGHSKILGFALDGYPIYGPYGYDSPLDMTTAPRCMTSGYTLKNSSYRTSAVSNLGNYPMGTFNEDWQFTGGTDLDVHNGRYCKTPDYPNGTYAYFCTVNPANFRPVYPYVIGTTFYGVPNGASNGTWTPGTNDYTAGAGSQPNLYTIDYITQASNFDGPQSRWTLSNGNSMRIRATGVPYHSFHNAGSVNIPKVKNVDLTFQFRGGANIAASGTDITTVGSKVAGYWLNGVAVYGPNAGTMAPNNYSLQTGYTYNAASQAGTDYGYSFSADAAGGETTADNTYTYRDYNFATAWLSGSGSSIIGTPLTTTKFSVSAYPGGPVLPLTNATSSTILGPIPMTCFGGDAIKDMFRMRNASGLRNMTLVGKLGTLTAQNKYLTKRPTGNSYVALDPGTGPYDTTAWIYKRSPYIQNITTFGYGCNGVKVDGYLHAGGNKSITANDFTQIVSDGIGAWIVGPDSKAELISVFSYYAYAGYFAEDGGRIRTANGNSSYGVFGVVAEGYDISESPITATVNNRSQQATATLQQSFGTNANILKLQYANAGQNYYTPTTNLLTYSNNFVTNWTTDNNLVILKNVISPSTFSDGWSLSAQTGGTDSSYIYQNITVTPTGKVYTNLSGSNVSGGGASATFDVTVNATGYSAVVNAGSGGGTGYVFGNQITIYGSQVGGIDGTNDVTLTVTDLLGSAILKVSAAGTIPAGTALNYTISVYAKQNTAAAFDLYAIFSGTNTVSSYVSYNFTTGVATSGNGGDGGLVPTSFGAQAQSNGWYRVYMTVYDTNALNNQLQVRIYPRTKTGPIGSTYFYGAQAQIGSSLTFYLTNVATTRYASYANYNIVGAGINANVIADETRSGSVFQTRVVADSNGVIGGTGYMTASNNAQQGLPVGQITIAASDQRVSANYVGMRVIVTSGTAAGQYGFITNYDSQYKIAKVGRESVPSLSVVSANGSTNLFTLASLADVNVLYVNQPLQFVPTYYTTTVTATSQTPIIIVSTTGSVYNYFTVASTAGFYVNMPINFSGNVYGGVISNYTYYVSTVLSTTTFQVSATLFGSNVFLTNDTTSTGMLVNVPSGTSYLTGSTTNMVVNMPIQFTGSSLGGITGGAVYYISDVIDASNFTISGTLNTLTVTATDSSTNRLSVASVASLVACTPIVFSGTLIGGVTLSQKYYISTIIPASNQFTIAASLITVTVTATASVTNLITCTSTAGFVANNPIRFAGRSFGGIQSEQTYYILAVNSSTTFTIATQQGGSSAPLQPATGVMYARTCPSNASVQTAATGAMTATTTAAKTVLTTGSGTMNALFSTPIFGGVQAGTTYYVLAINPGATNTFSITASSGGTQPFALITASGSMQTAEIGWDHVNPATPAVALDTTSAYFIEPRLTYSTPGISQTNPTGVSMSTNYSAIAYGVNFWMAIPQGGSTIATSTDGTTWTPITLPTTAPISGNQWQAIAYGNSCWVIIQGGSGVPAPSVVLYSFANGSSWKQGALPSSSNWVDVQYGNGYFVAISSTGSCAYWAPNTSTSTTWTAGGALTSPGNSSYSSLAFGAGTWVAIGSGSNLGTSYNVMCYSINNGASWTTGTGLAAATLYNKVVYGNGRFVITSSSSNVNPLYSLDGVTWYTSPYIVKADTTAYGNGVFLALTSGNTTAYSSEDGRFWKTQTIGAYSMSAAAFGFKSTTYDGTFVTVGGTAIVTNIAAGTTAKGRPSVTAGVITSINEFETGSAYPGTLPISVFDPNVTIPVALSPRVANGVLSAPTFINRGQGYNTTSTTIAITGSGFADDYQTSTKLYVQNLTQLPRPGDDLEIVGITSIFKVTTATALNGSTAPNLTALIQISPGLTAATAPQHAVVARIRQKYSQVRLTNHDFLNIGYGNAVDSNYPGVPPTNVLSAQNQTIENNYGRVFYTSTDQDGNFQVGNLFGVQQATGIVTLNASQFDLSGLSNLTLGGIAVGGSSVVVTQFSTDATFVANSNNIIPTQKAIKSYLSSRLSQGGSNTFTGLTTAGSVLIGGPNVISNVVPQGTPGSTVRVLNQVNFTGNGGYGQVDGGLMALDYFLNSASRRGNA